MSQLTEILYQPGHFVSKVRLVLQGFARRLSVLRLARNFDAILIFREAALIGPAIYEKLLARTGKPIIYDFDDAIWSRGQVWMNGIFSRLRFPSKTADICRLASTITVGNEFLASYARGRNPSVVIIPSSIELENYPAIPESDEAGKFVVCWTGSTSTLPHFEHARDALEMLARTVPLVVKVICSRPPDRPIDGAETRFVPWSANGEAQEVGDCHVGIMPLPDDEVSRGKCAMKALQFMATGRPVVVSPVGINAEVVRSGHNGFTAVTAEEWVSALSSLAASAELRGRLGTNARATVMKAYSAEIAAGAFAEVVRCLFKPGTKT